MGLLSKWFKKKVREPEIKHLWFEDISTLWQHANKLEAEGRKILRIGDDEFWDLWFISYK